MELVIDCVVVYETLWGNARLVAEAIADGLATSGVMPVHRAAEADPSADLLVVGGPTHARGLTRGITRRMAVQAASEPSSRHLIRRPPAHRASVSGSAISRPSTVVLRSRSTRAGIVRRS
ncbi:MAG: hypothetical protein ACXVD8_13275 [Actinomycetota bacterium]